MGNYTGNNPNAVYPTGDSTYFVMMTDSIDTCYSSLHVIVSFPEIDTIITLDPFCGGINGIIDISASGEFGSGSQLKRELGTEIAAVLGFSAIKNNDKVGLILFSDNIEKFIFPKKGKSHVLRVIRELLYTNPRNTGTSISNSLDYLLKVAKRKSVVFIISDFLDTGYNSSLKIVSKKHDLIAIQLYDPAEYKFPNIGLAKVEDPETGEMFWIDTTSKRAMKELEDDIKFKQSKFSKNAKKIGFDLIPISTDEDFVDPLMSFFKKREKRY